MAYKQNPGRNKSNSYASFQSKGLINSDGEDKEYLRINGVDHEISEDYMEQSQTVPKDHMPIAEKHIKKHESEGYKVESVKHRPGGISTEMSYEPTPPPPETPDPTPIPQTSGGKIKWRNKRRYKKAKRDSKILNKKGGWFSTAKQSRRKKSKKGFAHRIG